MATTAIQTRNVKTTDPEMAKAQSFIVHVQAEKAAKAAYPKTGENWETCLYCMLPFYPQYEGQLVGQPANKLPF